jgi:hypothetical protein
MNSINSFNGRFDEETSEWVALALESILNVADTEEEVHEWFSKNSDLFFPLRDKEKQLLRTKMSEALREKRKIKHVAA